MKNRYNLEYVKKIEKALFDKSCDASLKCKPTFAVTMNDTGDVLVIGHSANGYYMENSYYYNTEPFKYIVKDVSLRLIAMLIADNDVR